MTRYLFHAWEEVEDQIKEASHILLLLDYDGTLVPITKTPEMALLPQDTRYTLETLRNHPKFSLGVISGRTLTEIQELIGLEGIYYAGNHGLEMNLKGTHFIHPEVAHFIPLLRKINHELASYLDLDRYKGAFLEDKGLGLSLHWRNLSPLEVPKLKEKLELTLAPYRDKLILTAGKKVWEIRPKLDWNKGSAVLKILEFFPKGKVMPIYLGDDETDEDVFEALCEMGLTARVGDEKANTKAHYYLKEQGEVLNFLWILRACLKTLSMQSAKLAISNAK